MNAKELSDRLVKILETKSESGITELDFILRALVDAAIGGDVEAAKIVLDRVCPVNDVEV